MSSLDKSVITSELVRVFAGAVNVSFFSVPTKLSATVVKRCAPPVVSVEEVGVVWPLAGVCFVVSITFTTGELALPLTSSIFRVPASDGIAFASILKGMIATPSESSVATPDIVFKAALPVPMIFHVRDDAGGKPVVLMVKKSAPPSETLGGASIEYVGVNVAGVFPGVVGGVVLVVLAVLAVLPDV